MFMPLSAIYVMAQRDLGGLPPIDVVSVGQD
jgi:hypothetical protein